VGTVTRAHSLAGSRTTEENEPRHSDEGSLAGSGTTRVWSSGEARSADCVDELSSVLLGAVTLWGGRCYVFTGQATPHHDHPYARLQAAGWSRLLQPVYGTRWPAGLCSAAKAGR